jgi:hypothetical protein
MHYKLNIKPQAHRDIQEGIDWYNSQQPRLGIRFHTVIKQEFETLRKNPFFQVRYDGIRCLPLKKFPYMIHFVVEEENKRIVVLGIINTHKDPARWENVKRRK